MGTILRLRTNGDVSGYKKVEFHIIETREGVKNVVNSLYNQAVQKNSTGIYNILKSVNKEQRDLLFLQVMQIAFTHDSSVAKVIIPEFLKFSIDINIQDKETGDTSLHYAATFAQDLVPVFIKSGANVNLSNHSKLSPLIILSSRQRPDLVKMLIDAGADVNVNSDRGYTPLLAALRPMFGNYTDKTAENLELLLKAGANVDVRYEEGGTPYSIMEYVYPEELRQRMINLLDAYKKMK